MDALTLPGETGSGGGQVLRTALFLSLVTGKAFTATNVRAGRPNPGLKAQHAAILRTLEAMTGSEVTGGERGSTEVAFRPGTLRAGACTCEVGTAGSIPLVLQTLLPVALATRGETVLDIHGGTDVPFAPTIDWIRLAYLPWIAPLGRVGLEIVRRGFAPDGGGHVRVTVDSDAPAHASSEAPAHAGRDAAFPRAFRAHVKTRLGTHRHVQGAILSIEGTSLAEHRIGRDVAGRQAFAAHAHLIELGVAPDIEVQEVDADGLGTSVTLAIRDDKGNRLGSDRLGSRGRPAEDVGRIAAQNLVEDWKSGATVDRHLADHVVPWVALGAGAVRVPHETPHLTTNAWVCNQFLGDNAVRTDRNLVR